jgi:hypothetical protein
MIYNNNSQLDREDVAVLFAAMVQVGEVHGEDLDRSMVAVGYGEALARCIAAAGYVAQLHTPECEEWDGLRWFEVLESFDTESLAYLLYLLEVAEGEDTPVDWHDAVREAVVKWFNLSGEPWLADADGYPKLSSAGGLLLGDE